MRALVHGLAITGVACVRALTGRGHEVVVTDDDLTEARLATAHDLGVELRPLPEDGSGLDRLVRSVDVVMPAPGVPERHRVHRAAAAAGTEVASEIEIAYRWEQERVGGPRPILAVTGTDGKTTTTELTVEIVRAGGLRAESLGNTERPLIGAIDARDAAELDVLVVEATSFRLAPTRSFRADAAAWLNLAPDHLDWHDSLDTYIAAKQRIFAQQRATDAAIGFVDDPIVMAALARAPGRRRTFGRSGSDYRVDGGELVGPSGPIAAIAGMWRSLPHDLTNALAAAALVLETGVAGPEAVERGLAAFTPPPHRLEPVGTWHGVEWFNDSKATTPHAAATAIRAFGSVVVIAGGSRKGVDLSPMAAVTDNVRALVAIGDAAADVRSAFAPTTDVRDAASMADAITTAAHLARPGDAVVLSPGCASFDWYRGFDERGDDFRRLVKELVP